VIGPPTGGGGEGKKDLLYFSFSGRGDLKEKEGCLSLISFLFLMGEEGKGILMTSWRGVRGGKAISGGGGFFHQGEKGKPTTPPGGSVKGCEGGGEITSFPSA